MSETAIQHLLNAADTGALYEVQYVDCDVNQWTVPCMLTKDRADKVINDLSVERVRITFE